MKKVVLAALFAISSPVFAQGYVGLGLGRSYVDIESTPYTVNKVDSDSSPLIFAGAELNEYFSAEIGYTDFGNFSRYDRGQSTDGVYNYDESLQQSLDASAFYAAIVGRIPLNVFELFAMAGAARWDVDYIGHYRVSIRDAGTGAYVDTFSASASFSESGTDPMFGAGLSFNSDVFILRAMFQRFTDVGNEDSTGTTDIDMVSLSAAVKF